MSVDIKQYNELKEKNAVEIIKTENSQALSFKKYDDRTGIRLPDEIQGFDLEELTKKKEELQTEITSIDAFLAEYNAVK